MVDDDIDLRVEECSTETARSRRECCGVVRSQVVMERGSLTSPLFPAGGWLEKRQHGSPSALNMMYAKCRELVTVER